MVNLEGVFTDSSDAVSKQYRFTADPDYAQVLSEGSVEAVSLENNHSGDFREKGRADTRYALDAVNVAYAGEASFLITELDGGFKIGVVSYNTVERGEGAEFWNEAVRADISACRDAGCSLIIGFMHWALWSILRSLKNGR